MNKRKFIKNLISSLPLSALAPGLFSIPALNACGGGSSSTESGDTTRRASVIVIGAGMAGLAAASTLQKQGYKVTVLEAQSKVGGRISTDRSLGIAFDQGASWIHGPTGNPITPLAMQSGANTFLTDDNSVAVYDNTGIQYSDAAITNSEGAYNTVRDSIPSLGGLSQSFLTVFNANYPQYMNNRLWMYMLSAYLEFDIGADLSNLSSLYFEDDEKFSGADVIVTNGYDTIVKFLAQDLNVVLNTTVTDVNFETNDHVTVTTSTGNTYQATYAIIAVPLGVLKRNVINFTPALPTSKIAAMTKMGMGNMNKFLLTWDTPFWDTTLQYIGYTPNTMGQFNYFMNVNKFVPNANALMTFAFGDFANTSEDMSDNDIISAIMSNLKVIYGASTPPPTHMLRTRWGQNPYAYGSYSYAANGTTTTDFDTMARALNNQIFFAGEHSIRQYRGTVHGAYLSGTREAAKILALSVAS